MQPMTKTQPEEVAPYVGKGPKYHRAMSRIDKFLVDKKTGNLQLNVRDGEVLGLQTLQKDNLDED